MGVGMGTCISAGRQTHVCTCSKQSCLPLQFATLFFEAVSLTDLDRLAGSELRDPPVSISQDYRQVTLGLGFYIGSGDLNSSPHARAALHPQVWLFTELLCIIHSMVLTNEQHQALVDNIRQDRIKEHSSTTP